VIKRAQRVEDDKSGRAEAGPYSKYLSSQHGSPREGFLLRPGDESLDGINAVPTRKTAIDRFLHAHYNLPGYNHTPFTEKQVTL